MKRPAMLLVIAALLGTATCGGSVSVGVCGDWWCVGGPVVFNARVGCVDCDFPTSIAVGDFDADGHEDVAGGGRGEGSVAIVYGDGAGGIRASHRLTFGTGASSDFVVAGAFNGDTIPDLAVLDASLADVRIFFAAGDGDFTFAGAPLDFSAGSIRDVAAGAIDGDTLTDLVVLLSTNEMIVLLGRGAGQFVFAPGSPIALGVAGSHLALADFVVAAPLDVVVLDETANTLSTWIGDGAGGFTAASAPFAAGPQPVALAAGAFDTAPGTDVAVVDGDDGRIRVFLSNGNGSFSPAPQTSPVLPSLEGLDLIAVPGADAADLAVAYEDDLLGTANLVGLANLGGGVFGPPSEPAPIGGVEDMQIANLNGDARPDLVIAQGNPGLLAVILGGTREP